VLVARLDSMGDVLLAGPAVRAIAAGGAEVTMLVSSRGVAAAELLPGVERTIVFDAPWVLAEQLAVRRWGILAATLRMAAGQFDDALIVTSHHQSPHLAVRDELPEVDSRVRDQPYLVLHPGTDAGAQRWPPQLARATVRLLTRRGWRVAVTGGPEERALTRYVSGSKGVVDLGGRTDLAALAAVLRSAQAVVVGNTGPAHLAAAVGTPVVALFAPTVPVHRWEPHGVAHVILGDQGAPCAGTRVRECVVPGHPCLASVAPEQVCAAVESLVGVAA
jgi:ADP-heptose:LPS heptosyltransferase